MAHNTGARLTYALRLTEIDVDEVAKVARRAFAQKQDLALDESRAAEVSGDSNDFEQSVFTALADIATYLSFVVDRSAADVLDAARELLA
jgi:hypothetical protein